MADFIEDRFLDFKAKYASKRSLLFSKAGTTWFSKNEIVLRIEWAALADRLIGLSEDSDIL